jgi:hypothetical protein
VLQRLQENDLSLKAEKCIFKAWEIEFLGMIIGPGRIKMDLIKITAITSWLILKCIKDVQAFLGLTNFYCHFVYNFSHVATPLHLLMWKGVVWRWEKNQQDVFDELKKHFVEGPILIPVDFT